MNSKTEKRFKNTAKPKIFQYGNIESDDFILEEKYDAIFAK
jgi:hypothetical protein